MTCLSMRMPALTRQRVVLFDSPFASSLDFIQLKAAIFKVSANAGVTAVKGGRVVDQIESALSKASRASR